MVYFYICKLSFRIKYKTSYLLAMQSY